MLWSGQWICEDGEGLERTVGLWEEVLQSGQWICDNGEGLERTVGLLLFFFCFLRFFYRSSSALHRRSSTEILSRPLGYLL